MPYEIFKNIYANRFLTPPYNRLTNLEYNEPNVKLFDLL